MTRVHTFAVGLMVPALVAGLLADQVPQRDRRPTPSAEASIPLAPTGTASIQGQVVAGASGTPIGLAAVVLIGTRTGVLKVASADRAGGFSFTNLPADRYTIGASKAPYLGAIAGARRPARPGSPVVVADGAAVTDVRIRLPMGASLEGTVFGQDGRPVPGAMIGATRRVVRNGERILVPASSAAPPGLGSSVMITDERGRYRIYGLEPGEYVISVLAREDPGLGAPGIPALTDADVDAALTGAVMPAPAVPQRSSSRPAPVYYPGTVFADEAVGVLVGVGEERTGLDIQVRNAEAARITGTISMADGSAPPQNTMVRLTTAPGSSALQTGASSRLDANGGFTIANQPPGHYVLVVRAQNAYGVATVDLAGIDAAVSIVMHPPVTLTGRVTAPAGTAPPSLAGLRFEVSPLSSALSGVAGPGFQPTNAQGEFRVTNVVTSRYVIRGAPFFGASDASVSWGLGSVHVDGADVTDRAFDVRIEAAPKDIVLTLTDVWQDISGRVTNAQGAGVSDYTMLAFPVDEEYWLYESRRVVTAKPDDDGQYRLGGPGPALLPAGAYYLAAVTDVSKDEQFDPAFLKALIPAALRVQLEPGARVTQDLRVQ